MSKWLVAPIAIEFNWKLVGKINYVKEFWKQDLKFAIVQITDLENYQEDLGRFLEYIQTQGTIEQLKVEESDELGKFYSFQMQVNAQGRRRASPERLRTQAVNWLKENCYDR